VARDLSPLLLVGHAGEAAPEKGVTVGAEDAGGDDVVECLGERVVANVDGLGRSAG
jgi:hypothetical protein